MITLGVTDLDSILARLARHGIEREGGARGAPNAEDIDS
jgi:hypothetical protein